MKLFRAQSQINHDANAIKILIKQAQVLNRERDRERENKTKLQCNKLCDNVRVVIVNIFAMHSGWHCDGNHPFRNSLVCMCDAQKCLEQMINGKY